MAATLWLYTLCPIRDVMFAGTQSNFGGGEGVYLPVLCIIKERLGRQLPWSTLQGQNLWKDRPMFPGFTLPDCNLEKGAFKSFNAFTSYQSAT